MIRSRDVIILDFQDGGFHDVITDVIRSLSTNKRILWISAYSDKKELHCRTDRQTDGRTNPQTDTSTDNKGRLMLSARELTANYHYYWAAFDVRCKRNLCRRWKPRRQQSEQTFLRRKTVTPATSVVLHSRRLHTQCMLKITAQTWWIYTKKKQTKYNNEQL